MRTCAPYLAAAMEAFIFVGWGVLCYWLGRRSVLRYRDPTFDSVRFEKEKEDW